MQKSVASEQTYDSLHHNVDLVEQVEDSGTQRPDLYGQKNVKLQQPTIFIPLRLCQYGKPQQSQKQ